MAPSSRKLASLPAWGVLVALLDPYQQLINPHLQGCADAIQRGLTDPLPIIVIEVVDGVPV
jgi:hypothetical protein